MLSVKAGAARKDWLPPEKKDARLPFTAFRVKRRPLQNLGTKMRCGVRVSLATILK